MARQDISSDSKFEKIDELSEAAAITGPHHSARILDGGMKADRCPEWLDKASPQDSKFDKNRWAPKGCHPWTHHCARILLMDMKAIDV